MKTRKLNKKKCFLTFLIALAIVILIYTILTKSEKNEEIRVLFNNEFIELSDEVIIEDDEIIYFSKDDIRNIFDDTIYYNDAEKELITTYNTHVALLKVDETYALINDENVELEGRLKGINKEIYIPLKDMQEVYDIDVSYSSNTNIIVIDSTLNKKVEANLIAKTKLKSKKGILGKKLESLIIGDTVTVLEESGNYKKVKTKNRKYRFCKNKKTIRRYSCKRKHSL